MFTLEMAPSSPVSRFSWLEESFAHELLFYNWNHQQLNRWFSLELLLALVLDSAHKIWEREGGGGGQCSQLWQAAGGLMVRPKRTHFKFKQMRFVHKLCPALLLLHVGDVYIVVIAEEELLGRTSAASEGRILFQDPTFFCRI